MNKYALIGLIVGWCILKIVEYYFLSYFTIALLWLGLSLILLIAFIIQLAKLIKERKLITKLRISKVVVFAVLFYLTLYPLTVQKLMEKADWKLFYSKRMEIVEQVKQKDLMPNVEHNKWLCKLPYDFPVISNGGNEIGISQNEIDSSVTVTFFIFRNFFDATSYFFIYTNDNNKKKALEHLIEIDPEYNWKINDNWYRTCKEVG